MKNAANYLLVAALLIGPALLVETAAQQAAESQPAERIQGQSGTPAASQAHTAAPTQEGGAQTDGASESSKPAEQAPEHSSASATSMFMEHETDEQTLASQLLGYSVTNPKGENVGQVKDLILDQNQRPVGMVISVGGFFGVGGKHIALPLNEFQINRAKRIVQLNFSREELNKAPSFKAQ